MIIDRVLLQSFKPTFVYELELSAQRNIGEGMKTLPDVRFSSEADLNCRSPMSASNPKLR
jgi:hypothetical protein